MNVSINKYKYQLKNACYNMLPFYGIVYDVVVVAVLECVYIIRLEKSTRYYRSIMCVWLSTYR